MTSKRMLSLFGDRDERKLKCVRKWPTALYPKYAKRQHALAVQSHFKCCQMRKPTYCTNTKHRPADWSMSGTRPRARCDLSSPQIMQVGNIQQINYKNNTRPINTNMAICGRIQVNNSIGYYVTTAS
eukprot:6173031-Pleurochrysis_carterae.AAC.1